MAIALNQARRTKRRAKSNPFGMTKKTMYIVGGIGVVGVGAIIYFATRPKALAQGGGGGGGGGGQQGGGGGGGITLSPVTQLAPVYAPPQQGGGGGPPPADPNNPPPTLPPPTHANQPNAPVPTAAIQTPQGFSTFLQDASNFVNTMKAIYGVSIAGINAVIGLYNNLINVVATNFQISLPSLVPANFGLAAWPWG